LSSDLNREPLARDALSPQPLLAAGIPLLVPLAATIGRRSSRRTCAAGDFSLDRRSAFGLVLAAAAFVMAKGASSSKQEGTASTEQKAVEVESKRLLDLSFSRGVLSQNKAHPANPLRPSKGLVFSFFLGVLSFRAYIISFSSVAA
jgi:hypothetical protein